MKVRIYNNTLNPALWDGLKLKPDVAESLKSIGQSFYKDTELTAPIKDIIMVGSSANYNWSDFSDIDIHIVIDFKDSDIDIHIVIDFKDVSEDVEMVEKMVNAIKGKWNEDHDIHVKGFNVEVYIQDISKKNRSTGVYSLLNNKWVTEPKKENFELDKEQIQQKYSDMVLKIKNALESESLVKLKKVLKDLYDMREVGLNKSGEFSTENIVFKVLRSRGHLDKLRNGINQIFDKKASLKES